jgi:alkylation response protein AidB-like acyl-CoA dehydrogenase
LQPRLSALRPGLSKGQLRYAQERKAFGKPLIEHQGISFKLADMAVKLEAARNFVLQSRLAERQQPTLWPGQFHGQALCADAAMWITTEAVQIHGGYGYVKEYHVERLMREAKVTQIYEGTS